MTCETLRKACRSWQVTETADILEKDFGHLNAEQQLTDIKQRAEPPEAWKVRGTRQPRRKHKGSSGRTFIATDTTKAPDISLAGKMKFCSPTWIRPGDLNCPRIVM